MGTKKSHEDDLDEVETSCGIGSWRPKCMQFFASPIFLLINISIISVAQNAAASLMYNTMTTLERRYAFDSKISSVNVMAADISNLIFSPIIGYYSIRYNRSKLIGYSQILLACSCFFGTIPYFIYGPATHLLNQDSLASRLANSTESDLNMCYRSGPLADMTEDCSGSNSGSTVWLAAIILFVANFFRGIGFTVYWVIAMPFVDDNVPKKESPLFLSVMHSIMLFGFVFGSLLSSFFLKFYEDPWNDPGLSSTDPRFVGAWWLGFFFLGVFILIAALPMFLFPPQFKNASVDSKLIKKQMKQSGGTKSALKRFLTNPLIILFFLGNTTRYFGTSGFYQLFNKYIESQYRQSSSVANLIMGTAGLLPIVFGILVGGFLIHWFRPSTRLLFILVFLAEFTSFFSIGSGLFLGCDPINLNGKMDYNGQFDLGAPCSGNCSCSTRVFTPVCQMETSTTYFSPCHAGCSEYDSMNSTFSSCSCLNTDSIVTKGYCSSDLDCFNSLRSYVAAIMVGAFVSALAKTGNSLITFRTVDPMDKSFVNGLLSSLVSAFSFIPCLLLYGHIADSSCLVWEKKCGKLGNCWIYDQEKFRKTFLIVTIIFYGIGSLFDFLMIFFSDRIHDLYGEDELDDYAKTNHVKDVAIDSSETTI